METQIISAREIQRNYKRILENVRNRREPIILGTRGRAEAVVLSIDEFKKMRESLTKRKNGVKWLEVKKMLETISKMGRQDISLSEYVLSDRKTR